jgi:hypothetical protein
MLHGFGKRTAAKRQIDPGHRISPLSAGMSADGA